MSYKSIRPFQENNHPKFTDFHQRIDDFLGNLNLGTSLDKDNWTMKEEKTFYHCLNCDRSEAEIPLVSLRYDGSQNWVCTQCLPTLIHQPQRLAGKLVGAEKFDPAPPDKH